MHDPYSPDVPAALLHTLLHDLIGMVTGVHSSSAFALIKHEKGELTAGDLTRVNRAAAELGRYLSGLNAWSQFAQAGGVHLRKERLLPEKLSEIVDRAVERLSETAAVREVRFDVRHDSFAALGSGAVMANERWLAAALDSVLDNAVRYSYRQTTVGVRGFSADPASFAVRVENRGLLIHPDEIEHCTEWLWRGREAEYNAARGFGIGLWVTETVMKAHGGRVRISSTDLGQGALTRVELVLPAAGRGGDEVFNS